MNTNGPTFKLIFGGTGTVTPPVVDEAPPERTPEPAPKDKE